MCYSHSHSVTRKNTITLSMLGSIILIIVFITDSLSSARNCYCCTEAFQQQRVQYHTRYRAGATTTTTTTDVVVVGGGGGDVPRYSSHGNIEQTQYEYEYDRETTESFSVTVYPRSQSATTFTSPTASSVGQCRHTPMNSSRSSPSCGVFVVAWPKLNDDDDNDDDDDDDGGVDDEFIHNNIEDIIISSKSCCSINSNKYDIASIWANSLEPKIPFHKGSRIWLEQKQQQQILNERKNSKVNGVNGKQ